MKPISSISLIIFKRPPRRFAFRNPYKAGPLIIPSISLARRLRSKRLDKDVPARIPAQGTRNDAELADFSSSSSSLFTWTYRFAVICSWPLSSPTSARIFPW